MSLHQWLVALVGWHLIGFLPMKPRVWMALLYAILIWALLGVGVLKILSGAW